MLSLTVTQEIGFKFNLKSKCIEIVFQNLKHLQWKKLNQVNYFFLLPQNLYYYAKVCAFVCVSDVDLTILQLSFIKKHEIKSLTECLPTRSFKVTGCHQRIKYSISGSTAWDSQTCHFVLHIHVSKSDLCFYIHDRSIEHSVRIEWSA